MSIRNGRASSRAVQRLCLCAASALVAGGVRADDAMTRAAPERSAPTAIQEVDGDSVVSRSDLSAVLPKGQAVSIDNPYGDVHVRFGGFDHRIETHAVLQEPAGSAHVELNALERDGEQRYALVARLPGGATLRDGQRLDLSVLLPEGHALRVRTEHGAIDVRGVRGDVDLVSVDGNLELRNIRGVIQAQTGSGAIEASLSPAPRGSKQRLATTTGEIRVGVDDRLDAQLDMTTASQFATDYSLTITRRPGAEANKLARAVIGRKRATIALESARGEIRLLRRATFTPTGKGQRAETEESEDNDSD